MKTHNSVVRRIGALGPALLLIGGFAAKSLGVPVACFWSATGCEKRTAKCNPPFLNQWGVTRYADWICNGTSSSFYTCTGPDDNGGCCVTVAAPPACPTTNLCPCPYTHVD